jgi:nucleoside-diphosphate-sugar epimerase
MMPFFSSSRCQWLCRPCFVDNALARGSAVLLSECFRLIVILERIRDDVRDESEYQRTNVDWVNNVAGECTEKGIHKIVFTSTLAG